MSGHIWKCHLPGQQTINCAIVHIQPYKYVCGLQIRIQIMWIIKIKKFGGQIGKKEFVGIDYEGRGYHFEVND